jgi:hypothetical protein
MEKEESVVLFEQGGRHSTKHWGWMKGKEKEKEKEKEWCGAEREEKRRSMTKPREERPRKTETG